MLACVWECSDRNCVGMEAWGREHGSRWTRACGQECVVESVWLGSCGSKRVDGSVIFFIFQHHFSARGWVRMGAWGWEGGNGSVGMEHF